MTNRKLSVAGRFEMQLLEQCAARTRMLKLAVMEVETTKVMAEVLHHGSAGADTRREDKIRQ
jgi:hypothetical protein